MRRSYHRAIVVIHMCMSCVCIYIYMSILDVYKSQDPVSMVPGALGDAAVVLLRLDDLARVILSPADGGTC